MADAKSLVRSRGGHRAYVSKIVNETAKLLDDVKAADTDDRRKKIEEELAVNEALLTDKLEELKAIDKDYANTIDDDAAYNDEVVKTGDYNRKVYSAIVSIRRYFDGIKSSKAASSSSSSSSSTASSSVSATVKMPKLNITAYNGDPLLFQSFWDSFESAVHKKSVDDVEKFQYLKGLLEGKASLVVQGMALTSANYLEARKLLKDRFGDPQTIIQANMDALLSLNQVQENDLISLRKLCDVIEVHIRNLGQFGVQTQNYGPVLISIISSKLPKDVNLEISRQMPDGAWTIDTLFGALKKEVIARERCIPSPNQPGIDFNGTSATLFGGVRNSGGAYSGGQQANQGHQGNRGRGRGGRGRRNNRRRNQVCIFCDGQHQSKVCRTLSSVEERREVIRQKNLCFICLRANHFANECLSNFTCHSCQGRHHEAICPNRNNTGGGGGSSGGNSGVGNNQNGNQNSNNGVQNNGGGSQNIGGGNGNQNNGGNVQNNQIVGNNQNGGNQNGDGNRSVTCCNINSQISCVLLQTARAFISDPEMKETSLARIIFDDCSQRSFITAALVRKLQLPVMKRKPLTVNAFGKNEENPQLLDVVRIKVRSQFDKRVAVEIEVFVVPMICAPVTNQVINLAKMNHLEFHGLTFADNSDHSTTLEIDILIGANFYWNFVTGLIKRSGNLVASQTCLGWVLNGRMDSEEAKNSSVNVSAVHVLQVQSDEISLEQQVKKFWEVEGIEESSPQNFDSSAFSQHIVKDDERYHVPLPMKPGMRSELPSNLRTCVKRVWALWARLKSDPVRLAGYNKVIQEQEKDGIIERCYDFPPDGNAHYLPHHDVIKEDRETTKQRIVYDASSGHPSLNDCLEKGENLVPLLLHVLIRFRSHKVAIVSDIEKAFLKVGVQEQYRNFLRFLWFDNVESSSPDIVVYRFTRVLFGVNASLFLLMIVVRLHLQNYVEAQPELVSYVLRNLFVDDHIGGADDVESGFKRYKELKEVFLAGGFNLRKWQSNDSSLQCAIERSENERGFGSPERKDEAKVLGVVWMKSADELQVPTKNVHDAGMNTVLTKRGILSIVASLYDPYGIIAPVVISFKAFFQKLAVSKFGWDEPLPGELQIEWLKLLDILSDDSLFKIQRYYFGGLNLAHFEKFTLHGFCDASDIAYAAVVYIIGITSNRILSSFSAAKTKVAPLVKPSTPIMELYGCVLLSHLVANVKEALTEEISISGVVCWSDSLDALHWIKNEKKVRPRAIQSRVMKIRKLVPAANWRHCPTELNPADVASRGMPTQRAVRKEFPKWIVGPEFIVMDTTKWPVDLSSVERSEEPETEIASVNCSFEPSTQVVCLHITDISSGKKIQKIKVNRRMQLDNIIEIERFGYLQKLLRVTALVFRCVENFRKSLRKEALVTGYIKEEEVAHAELAWIKSVQRHLEADSKQLNNTLGLILNEHGILLCKGRLEKADLTPSQINPILIPGSSHFARLLVQDAHLRTGHGTKKDTLVELRSRFWVTKGRNLVHHVLQKCARPCKRLESKAFNSVETPPLPGFRVRQSFPFATTGVDYLGPLLVRQVFDEHDTNMYKVWIVLYTCAVTRAIHLDVVPNSSASAFIRSLKRFIGRRGVPNLLISDNATCFKNEEVKLNAELIQLRVKWKFIVEAAPWWGGFWERLVQTVKRSLRKVLFRSSVTYEELETVVTNVEGIVNSRPLTYIYDDDVEEVLTPSHLLLGRRLLSTFDQPFDDGAEVDNAVLTRRMRYLKSLSDHYWQRFKEEYLLELRAQHSMGCDPSRSPVVGEVVVLEGQTKRNSWRLGKIVSLIHGADNRCRAAVVKTFDGASSHLTRRPIEKLYPIEIRSEVPVEESDMNNDELVTSSDNGTIERPRRVAADTGVLKRRLANMT